jgi:hypothetical protein
MLKILGYGPNASVDMKKIKISLMTFGFGCWACAAFAQTDPGSLTVPVLTNGWWTNTAHLTNSAPPPAWTNHHPVTLPPVVTNVPPPHSLPPRAFPADVQTLVHRFQDERDALIDQLKGASNQDRETILAQLKDLRDKFKDEMAKIRLQAQDQAQDMRQRLHDDRSRLLNKGASGDSGHKGR